MAVGHVRRDRLEAVHHIAVAHCLDDRLALVESDIYDDAPSSRRLDEASCHGCTCADQRRVERRVERVGVSVCSFRWILYLLSNCPPLLFARGG